LISGSVIKGEKVPVIDKDEGIEKTPDEIAVDLGERIRALRLAADCTQAVAADKAGVSVRSLRDLESGQGSTVQTLVRVLKALGVQEVVDAIAPTPRVSPLQLLKNKSRQRATGSR
jgi:transcriptional regulator with XRE-family HTH domain